MSDKDGTLFIGDSDPTCPAAMAPQPDGNVSGQSYQQMYQKFSCSRIDMYLENILPEWPIFTPDEVSAMQQRYLAGQGSDNDRLSMLVIMDLADTMNPFHSQDIQEFQFGLRYRRTIQTHALLALYWKRRGFHGFANEHITKAFALGSSSRVQWKNSSLDDHFADIVALWCCCFIIRYESRSIIFIQIPAVTIERRYGTKIWHKCRSLFRTPSRVYFTTAHLNSPASASVSASRACRSTHSSCNAKRTLYKYARPFYKPPTKPLHVSGVVH